MQSSFDRLTEVYVVFNQRLTEAHVQAVRVHELVRSHAHSARFEPPDEALLANFAVALETRNERIEWARQPIDEALTRPGRFGGVHAIHELRGIADSLQALHVLAVEEIMDDPVEILDDVQTQDKITRLFKSLSTQSGVAVAELREEVRAAQVRTERLTLVLILGSVLLGSLATVAVFFSLRPLRQLTERVRDLAQGDWSQRVELARFGGGDEVTALAREFNLMAAALEERERRLLRGERLAAAGQLAAQITHEIRNPLSSVALNVELLEDELAESSREGRHLLKEITKEVDRLTQVTEDYLSFARRPSPELVLFDLADEIRSLLEFMGPELMQSGVDVQVTLPDEPMETRGDANQLRQALINLVHNARDAALDDELQGERGPRVAVEARRDGREWVVRVADNGGGIPLSADAMHRIFEAFYTRKARGTGLGLPTVQQIVADHGGVVRVASTGFDGTVFEIRLLIHESSHGVLVGGRVEVVPLGDDP